MLTSTKTLEKNENCIFVFRAASFDLLGVIQQPHMAHPRGLYAVNGLLYAACYGNPIGKVVVISLKTLKKRLHFDVPRPRGLVVVNDRIYVTQVMRDCIGVYTKTGGCDAELARGRLCRPRGLTHDAHRLYVADSGADRIVGMTFLGEIVLVVSGVRRSTLRDRVVRQAPCTCVGRACAKTNRCPRKKWKSVHAQCSTTSESVRVGRFVGVHTHIFQMSVLQSAAPVTVSPFKILRRSRGGTLSPCPPPILLQSTGRFEHDV